MPENRTARYHSTDTADQLRMGDVIVVDDEVRTVHAVHTYGPGWQIHFHETKRPYFATAADRIRIVSRAAATDEEFDV